MGTTMRNILSNPIIARLLAREIKRAERRAGKPMPGSDGSSFKQNRRREVKLAARRKQRGLHKSARRKATC